MSSRSHRFAPLDAGSLGLDAPAQGVHQLTTFDGSGTAVIWGIVSISKSRRSNTEPRSLDWTKRSKDTGQFMDQKDQGKFKGVRRER